MAKSLVVCVTLTVATALICGASATLVDIGIVRNNYQSAAVAKHHPSRMAKRSFFVPNQIAEWFETRSDDGQRTLALRYCWKDPGYAQYKQWVQEALSETWHRLGVVKFQPLGVCSESQRDYRGYPLEVSFWNNTCSSWFQAGKGVQLAASFNSSCKPECTTSKDAEVRCIKKAAVHEFGHVLGVQHEQYRPDTPAKFTGTHCLDDPTNEAKGYLRMQHSFLAPWDEQSIMNYCSPGYYDFSIYLPLSLGDRAAVLSVYGTTVRFNSRCNDRNSNSLECENAVQRYCEAVFEDTPNMVGVVRNDTSMGFNVTCFKAGFIHKMPDDDYERIGLADDKQSVWNDICTSWAASFIAPEESKSKPYVGLMIDVGGSGHWSDVCVEPIWTGSVNLSLLAQESGDEMCLWMLRISYVTESHLRATPSCAASVDYYCEHHHNGAAGGLLETFWKKGVLVFKIVCFQALLKIELFGKQAVSTIKAPTPKSNLIPITTSTPDVADPDDTEGSEPDPESGSNEDSGSGSEPDPVADLVVGSSPTTSSTPTPALT